MINLEKLLEKHNLKPNPKISNSNIQPERVFLYLEDVPLEYLYYSTSSVFIENYENITRQDLLNIVYMQRVVIWKRKLFRGKRRVCGTIFFEKRGCSCNMCKWDKLIDKKIRRSNKTHMKNKFRKYVKNYNMNNY